MAPTKLADILDSRYQILDRLGAGSQGRVYRVRDCKLGRELALKVVESAPASLLREFCWLSSLSHPGLAQVIEISIAQNSTTEIAEGEVYFLSEYIAGPSLAPLTGQDVSDETAKDPNQYILDVGHEIACALSYLHSHKLAHGDVKPDNLRYRHPEGRELVLLDLGLTQIIGQGSSRGTLSYMAPESLEGQIDARSDLYSLGASLIEIASGQVPYHAKSRSELVVQILNAPREELRGRLSHLATPLCDFLLSLVQIDPCDRPSSARVVLEHVRRIREGLGLSQDAPSPLPNFSHPEFCGRASQVQTIRNAMDRFAQSESCQTLVVEGAVASGRSRAIQQAYLAHQIDATKREQTSLNLVRVSQSELEQNLQSLVDRYSDTKQRTLLWLHDIGAGLPARLSELSLPAKIMLIISREPSAGAAFPRVEIPPLPREHFTRFCLSLAIKPLPLAWIDRLYALTRGHVGRSIEALRLAALLPTGYDAPPDALFAHGALASGLRDQVRGLENVQRDVLECLALCRQPLSPPSLSAMAGVPESEIPKVSALLQELGLVEQRPGTLVIASAHYAQKIENGLSSARKAKLHRAALAQGLALSSSEKFRHLQFAGPVKQALSTGRQAMAEHISNQHSDKALAIALTLNTLLPATERAGNAVTIAELSQIAGNYKQARTFAKAAIGDAGTERAATLALARALRHLGGLPQSESLLQALLHLSGDDQLARAELSITLLKTGRFKEAEAQAGQCTHSDDPQILALIDEVLGLTAFYRGEHQICAQRFSTFYSRCQELGDKRLGGRAAGLLGMAMQQEGQLTKSAAYYSEAAHQSVICGAHHAAAVFRLNSATVEQRSAHYANALDSYRLAKRSLEKNGTPRQLAAVHWNRGNTLLCLGELDSALSEADKAESIAQADDDVRMQFFAQLLKADLCARHGQFDEADSLYNQAQATAAQHELAESFHASIHQAENRCLSGRGSELPTCITLRSASEVAEASYATNAEFLSCEARIALHAGVADDAIGQRLRASTQALILSDDLDIGWRIAVLAARVMQQTGNRVALRETIDTALTLLARVESRSPEAYLPGLRAHPDARALQGLRQSNLETAIAETSPTILPYRRLLTLSRRLNSEMRVDVLLHEIIDTAIELGQAERAFLLLRDSQGELAVRIARNISRTSLDIGEELSLSIAEKVAKSGTVLMTVDAGEDSRFDASKSIAALQLRSILAVPLRVRNRVIGTLYMDHRFRRAAFDSDSVSLVCELADIAAVAIENARLSEENRTRQSEIQRLNQSLSEKLEETEAQLVIVKSQLPAMRPERGFTEIIGNSAPMIELLSMAERAAGCNLPVVIAGESGTGKELLARAIHKSSTRADKPFVAINCGAIPEALLESELFGHMRGAFTGADRTRRGLFQVADGGTLFLDEIADTSLAMQSKLLRVLQEGEVRPLGSEAIVKVDIRVLCASNASLPDLVAQGGFREDLFYRLNVLNLSLPPLRERIEDIPEISAHILRKLAPTSRPTLLPNALRMLQSHQWPGNIRELENELSRALAMSEGKAIGSDHLSLSGSENRELTKQRVGLSEHKLLLKPQVEDLEQLLIREAMHKCDWNQSKAAILLGLSRYGLQKKLQRYGVSRE